MAYVRKTDTLVRDILKRVSEMSRTAREPYNTSEIKRGTKEHDDLAYIAEKVSWRETPELQTNKPSSWDKLLKSDKVFAYLPSEITGEVSNQSYVRIDAPESKPFVLSPSCAKLSAYYSSQLNFEVRLTHDDVPVSVTKWYATKAEKEAKSKELAEKFDSIREKLKLFMSQHASLNSALKEMPELELYVPNMYMQKLAEVSAPRNTSKPQRTIIQDLEIDVAELTTAAIAHRFAAAKQS